jgi:putative NADH-flavin reductase
VSVLGFPSMRVLVLGGTGPSGILIIRECIARGHTVVVYARSPSKIPQDLSSHERVTITGGQLDDLEKLKSSLDGVDAVLSALGPIVRSPFDAVTFSISKGYETLIQAVEGSPRKRLIALGTPSIEVRCSHDSDTLQSSKNHRTTKTCPQCCSRCFSFP